MNPKIQLKDLRITEQLARGNKAPYQALWWAKDNLLKNQLGSEEEMFQLLPAFLFAMAGKHQCSEDLQCHYQLEMDHEDQFQHCLVVSKGSIEVFTHCQHLSTLDGTFIKARHRLTLLVLTTLDGNNEILPLVWALVPVENKENWQWFLAAI